MSRYLILLIAFNFCFAFLGYSQKTAVSSVLTEAEKSIEEQFGICSDSIYEYLYSDSEIVARNVDKCEALLVSSPNIELKNILKFQINKVYVELNKDLPLNAIKLILDNEALANKPEITEWQKGTFRYIKGYTLMILKDYESAQATFYKDLEKGRMSKDTNLIISNLYSIGQLYSALEEYESAKKCFLELAGIKDVHDNMTEPTSALIDYELAESYRNLKEFEEAKKVIARGLAYVEQKKLSDIKADFLTLQGLLAIDDNDLAMAERMFNETKALLKDSENALGEKGGSVFFGKFLTEKGKFVAAKNTYLAQLEKIDSTDLEWRKKLYEGLEEVSSKMNDESSAYSYLKKSSAINKQIAEKENRLKTAYFKIKFESEQTEKENTLLAAQVQEEKNQQKLLFALIFAGVLGILALLGAYLQKQKYNKRLRGEVKNRTEELEHSNNELLRSNAELDEFNHILSHDLKEPLRSIVGFSSLAKKQINDNPKLEEYMTYIENGGQQLHQIIEDLSTFKKISRRVTQTPELVNTESLVRELELEVKQRLGKSNIEICTQNLPNININKELLDVTFRNLIENGAKYNEQTKPSLAINYRLKEGMHTFQFEDNGIGIASEYQDLVFQMFKRLHTRDVYTGSGLGLSIIRKMLHKVGGKIDLLRSAKGEGSLFEICIPVV